MGVWLVELVGAEKGEEVLYRGRTAESCLHCVVLLVHYAVAAAAGALQSAKCRRQRRHERNVVVFFAKRQKIHQSLLKFIQTSKTLFM